MTDHEKSNKENILDVVNMSPEDTRRLNYIALEIRFEYAKFIDEISKSFSDNELLWSVPLISRNIYNDDTFIKICRLKLVAEKLEQGQGQFDRVLVETDDEAACIIENGIFDDVTSANGEKHGLVSCFKKRRDVFISIIKLIRYEWSIKQYAKGKNCPISGDSALLFTPALSSGFKGGKYQDRYFTNIHNFSDRDLVFVPSLNMNGGYSLKKFIEHLSEDDEYKFFFLESFLNSRSYFEVLKYIKLCNRMLTKRYYFQGIDVTNIVHKSIFLGKSSTPALKGVLYNSCIKELKQVYPDIGNFVIWYEGRPNDIMEVASVRKNYTSAFCVAYEAYPLDNIFLSLYPTQFQNDFGVVASCTAIPSKKLYEEEFENYSKDTRIVEVPILRTRYLLKEKSDSNSKDILLLLPYDIGISSTLINMLNAYNKINIIRRVLIKNHPANKHNTMADYCAEGIMFKYEFVDCDIEECIKNVCLVITSSTASSFEVLFSKTQLVLLIDSGKLQRIGIPQNVFDDLFTVVYTQEELNSAIDTACCSEKKDYSALNNLFLTANKCNVNRLFA